MKLSLFTSFGIRQKLLFINVILLVAALFASGFAISEFIRIGDLVHTSGTTQVNLDETIQNTIIIQSSLAAIAVAVNGYSFVFGRSLTNPIRNASNVAKKISEGDLTANIETTKRNDELGELMNSLSVMIESLRQLVSEVHDTATRVASDCRESATATEELNSSVEEVSTTVQQIASGSQSQASDLAEAKAIVDGVSNNDSSDGSSATKKMSRIVELTNESSNKVRNLADKSAKITSVVETIRDIAEKTNLLALNAAIEAARAGESGRGFAVVADEVRRLAEGSTKSSEEIDEIIKQIQEEIQSTVKGIDVSTLEIEKGREVVDLSLKALSEIGKKVEEVAAVAEENASATDEVSAAADEQTTATREISESSQSIAFLAEKLERKVSTFKLQSKIDSSIESQPANSEITSEHAESEKSEFEQIDMNQQEAQQVVDSENSSNHLGNVFKIKKENTTVDMTEFEKAVADAKEDNK